MATTVGNLAVKLTADGSSFTSAMARSSKSVSTFARVNANAARGVSQLASKVSALAAAGAAFIAGGSLVALTKSSLDAIDATAKFADRIGITTESLIGLRHAAVQTGVATSALDTALQRMVRRVSEAASGTGEARGALAELGIDAKALAALSPDQQFIAIAGAMEGIASQGDRVRLAMKLFDTEGVALVNTMAAGAEGLREYQAEAERLGITLTRVDAAKIEVANDAIDRMRKVAVGAAGMVAVRLAPALQEAADGVVAFLTEGDRMQRWAEVAGQKIKAVATWAIEATRAVGNWASENRTLLVVGGKALLLVQGLNLAFRLIPGSAWAATKAVGLFSAATKAAATSSAAFHFRSAGAALATRRFSDAALFASTGLRRMNLAGHARAFGTFAAKIAAPVAGFGLLAAAAIRARQANLSYAASLNEVTRQTGILAVAQDLFNDEVDVAAAKAEVLAERLNNVQASAARLGQRLSEAQGADERLRVQEKITANLEQQVALAEAMRAAFEGVELTKVHESGQTVTRTDVAPLTDADVGAFERAAAEARQRLREMQETAFATPAIRGRGGQVAGEDVAAMVLPQMGAGQTEAEARAQQLADALSAIRREAASIGRTDIDIKVAELAELGAANEQLAQARQHLKAMDEAKRRLSASEGIADAIAGVQADLASLHVDPIELKIQPYIDVGLAREQIDRYRNLLKVQAATQLFEEQDRRAAAIRDSVATPAERARARFDEAEKLHRAGALDAETLERVARELRGDLLGERTRAGTIDDRGAESIEAGSQDAARLAAVTEARAMGTPQPRTTEQRQLDEAKRQRQVLERLERLLEQGNRKQQQTTTVGI